MQKLEINGIDIFNPLSDPKKMQAVIDSLTETMGEEFRQDIEERVKKTIILVAPPIFYGLKSFLNNYSIKENVPSEILENNQKLSDMLCKSHDTKAEFIKNKIKDIFPELSEEQIEVNFLRDFTGVINNLFRNGLNSCLKSELKNFSIGNIELFKKLGASGSDLDECAKHPKVKQLFSSANCKEFVQLEDSIKVEMLASNIFVKNAIEKIKSAELLNNEQTILSMYLDFVSEQKDSCCAFMLTNLKQDKSLQTFCVINSPLDGDTQTIIHEFVHIITAQLMQDKKYAKVGILLDKEMVKPDLLNPEKENPEYNLYERAVKKALKYRGGFVVDINLRSSNNETSRSTNEFLTDWFAINATERFRKKCVGELSGNADKESTYAYATVFLEDFVQKYKTDFAKIMMSSDAFAYKKFFGFSVGEFNRQLSSLYRNILKFKSTKFIGELRNFMQKHNCTIEEAVQKMQFQDVHKKIVATINKLLDAKNEMDKFANSHIKEPKKETEEDEFC